VGENLRAGPAIARIGPNVHLQLIGSIVAWREKRLLVDGIDACFSTGECLVCVPVIPRDASVF
jgi:hypothetical protein